MTNTTGAKREKTPNRIMNAIQAATTIIPFVVVFTASPSNHQDHQNQHFYWLQIAELSKIHRPNELYPCIRPVQ
jgi:high-affinity K+ transport system ATPase subunit B